MEVKIFRKKVFSAAILTLIPMGTLNPVSAAEQPISSDTSKLTETEKERLIRNRLLMKETMEEKLGKHAVPKDILDIIGKTEYALGSKNIVFKCPTPDEINQGVKVGHDENGSEITEFTNKDGLIFRIGMPVDVVKNHLETFKGVEVYPMHNGISCAYNNRAFVAYLIISDRFDLAFEKSQFREQPGTQEFSSPNPDVEFTLTPKSTPK